MARPSRRPGRNGQGGSLFVASFGLRCIRLCALIPGEASQVLSLQGVAMIDPNTETIISLNEAPKDLPKRRRGKTPSVSCLYRWTNAGCKGVVLEWIQIGGTRCTSREALARFFEALTAQHTGAARTSHSLAQQSQDMAAVERELDKAGL